MSIINDFKNEFRFSAHGRTSRRNFWIYQIGLFVLGLAVAMGCGTIIGLTNAVVGFWFIIAALLILPFGIANIFVTIRRLHDIRSRCLADCDGDRLRLSEPEVSTRTQQV